MRFNRLFQLPLLALCCISNWAEAQIVMVDASGTRGLGSAFGDSAKDQFDYKIDTGKRSVNATYLDNRSGENSWLWGMHGQASVPDSWDNVFKRAPNSEIALIGNFSRHPGPNDKAIHFATATAGVIGTNEKWRESATSVVQSHYDVGAQARLTYGIVPRGVERQWVSGAITIGVKDGSNINDLKKVKVDGEEIREGKLDHSISFPSTLRINFELPEKFSTDLVRKIPSFDNAKTYSLLTGVYGTIEPRNEGKPSHLIGISLNLREMVTPKNIPANPDAPFPHPQIDAKYLSYWKPTWTVYGEVSQPFGSGDSDVEGGVAVTFSWP